MKNMKTIFNNIKENRNAQNQADELMTQALVAVETAQYDEAYQLSEQVILLSESVEQRLAAMTILTLCIQQNQEETTRVLNIAYDQINQNLKGVEQDIKTGKAILAKVGALS
jgi:DNA polymerase sigma